MLINYVKNIVFLLSRTCGNGLTWFSNIVFSIVLCSANVSWISLKMLPGGQGFHKTQFLLNYVLFTMFYLLCFIYYVLFSPKLCFVGYAELCFIYYVLFKLCFIYYVLFTMFYLHGQLNYVLLAMLNYVLFTMFYLLCFKTMFCYSNNYVLFTMFYLLCFVTPRQSWPGSRKGSPNEPKYAFCIGLRAKKVQPGPKSGRLS